MNINRVLYLFYFFICVLLCSCSASNCPLENTVTCNYGFYDTNGTPIIYNDEITISTLLPGYKTVYIYKKLNEETVTLNYHDENYINNGYTEFINKLRCDTILINKISEISSIKVPMSYYSNNDTVIIAYSSIINKDTLYINHNSYTHVDLPECGTARFHTLNNIHSTDYGINNVEIVDADVNYEGNENIKIYFNGTAD